MGYLDDWNAEQREAAETWRRKGKALQAELDRIEVRSDSTKGGIGVIVNARGRVTNVRLTPQSLRLGDVELGRILLDTIERAQSEAERKVEAVSLPYTSDPEAAEAMNFIRGLLADDK